MNAAYAFSPVRLTLKAHCAAELMTTQVVSLLETAPLRDAVAMLVDRGFSGAPVVNEAGRAVGVLSLSDIVVHDRNRPDGPRAADRATVGDVMTPTVCSVTPSTPAGELIEKMLLLRVHRLFVTDNDGVLVGVIAMADVLRHLIA
jgi:CBS domain-containing protein